MNDNQKLGVYGAHLANFKNPLISKIVKDIIIHTPTLFFGASTSSTGKYHPLATNGVMGLVKHSVAVMLIAKDLLGNKTITSVFRLNDLSDIDKEIILAACLLHDNAKYGPENDILYSEKKLYTNNEHPRLVYKIAENAGLANIDKENGVDYLAKILNLIETHMGQWTDTNSRYSNPPIWDSEPLKAPSSYAQSFVHLCDYMASRKIMDTISTLSLPDDIEPELLEWFIKQNS